MNRTVYIVNKKTHDLSDAKNYGELFVLSEGNVNVFAIDKHLKKFRQDLLDSHEDDYILPCGSIPLNILAGNLMMEIHGRVNLLLYDLRTQKYAIRTYTRGDLIE